MPIVPALLFITVFLSETVSATAFKITPFNDYDILGNEISDPGFSQTLHYADGPGTKLYNGSVSAMSWTMGTNTTQIDNLHIYYTGNRVTGVLEDAEPVTTNGSMDYAGTTGKEMAVEYNEWGAMTKDEARGITSVTYDRLGNPSRVSFSSPRGSYASYVYSATGERLKATHYTSPVFQGGVAEASYLTDPESTGDNAENADNDENGDNVALAAIDSGISDIAGMTKLEYHGPVIYRNGKVDMVRFPGGYATISGSAVTFHYYTQDYLGNNRAVVNGSTGAIEQTVAYYPYGGVIASLGISVSKQPFKFSGKELTLQNGLNEYDFGARQYYQAVPHFTGVDPLCEKTPWLSPYLYCGNNPVNAIDPDGRSTWVTDIGNGMYQVIGGDLDDKDLNIYVYNKDKNGNYTVRGKSIGKTTSITSFYDSDNGIWSKESIIDTNDKSGIEFLTGIMEDNPPLADYMKDARNNHPYDFKATNGNEHADSSLDHYRGMPLGKAKDGTPIYSSARDIGNIAAGYIAAANGLSWKVARAGFDAYQSSTDRKLTTEGISTQNAEFYGYALGYTSNLTVSKNYNLARSLIMAPLTVIKSIFGK